MKKRYYIYKAKNHSGNNLYWQLYVPWLFRNIITKTWLPSNKSTKLPDFKSNKVNKVTLKSFQGNACYGRFYLRTMSKPRKKRGDHLYQNPDMGESFFTAYYQPQGLLMKTIDSSGESVSNSSYQYDAANRLTAIRQTTHATDNSSVLTETHYWQYTASGNL